MLPALAKPGSSSTSDEEECEVCGEKSNETEKLSDWVLSLLSGGDETDLGLQTEDDVLQSLLHSLADDETPRESEMLHSPFPLDQTTECEDAGGVPVEASSKPPAKRTLEESTTKALKLGSSPPHSVGSPLSHSTEELVAICEAGGDGKLPRPCTGERQRHIFRCLLLRRPRCPLRSGSSCSCVHVLMCVVCCSTCFFSASRSVPGQQSPLRPQLPVRSLRQARPRVHLAADRAPRPPSHEACEGGSGGDGRD